MLTTKDLCSYLRISRSSIYRVLVAVHGLKPVHIGGKVLWDRRDLDRLVDLLKGDAALDGRRKLRLEGAA